MYCGLVPRVYTNNLALPVCRVQVRDHFVDNVAMPMANAPNVRGVWFDDTDWLGCNDLCNEVHGMHLWPCDTAAKHRLFNGTVAWKKDVAQRLNAQDKIPIFSSINKWLGEFTGKNCPYNEREVALELFPHSYGRFYEGWGATCADIIQTQVCMYSSLPTNKQTY